MFGDSSAGAVVASPHRFVMSSSSETPERSCTFANLSNFTQWLGLLNALLDTSNRFTVPSRPKIRKSNAGKFSHRTTAVPEVTARSDTPTCNTETKLAAQAEGDTQHNTWFDVLRQDWSHSGLPRNPLNFDLGQRLPSQVGALQRHLAVSGDIRTHQQFKSISSSIFTTGLHHHNNIARLNW